MILAMISGGAATLNATIYSSSRVALALARDGELPAKFMEIHPQKRTPWVAIWGTGFVMIMMVLFLDLTEIIASADVLFLLLFFLVSYAAIILRPRHGPEAFPYKTPLFPLFPIISMLTQLILAVALLVFSWVSWTVAVIWIILGLLLRKSGLLGKKTQKIEKISGKTK